jgi:hypothetical protein
VIPSRPKGVERDSAAPESGTVDSNLFFSTRYKSVFSNRSPEKMQRLAERSTCVGLIELRPQKSEDGVATSEAAAVCERQIREESKALRLSRDCA